MRDARRYFSSLRIISDFRINKMQAKDKTNDDLATILQVSSLVDILRRRPVERIAPYTEHFRVLSTNFESLSRRLDVVRQGSHSDGTEKRPATALEPLPSYKPLRYKQAAAKTLQSAIKNIPTILTTIAAIKDAENTEGIWLQQDRRIAHLQPIHRLRGHEESQSVLAHDRILLILSCHSLANDFRAFEKANGWKPKEDQLIERISHGQDPSTQSIGKHLQNFLSSLSALPEDRERIDAGIRFGTKLRVLDAMGEPFGVGLGLSLLLGFEYQNSSRLSYNAFPALRIILESNIEQKTAIQQLSEKVGWWFQNFLVQYHRLYSSLSPSPILKGAFDLSCAGYGNLIQHQEPILREQAYASSQNDSGLDVLMLECTDGFQIDVLRDMHEAHPGDVRFPSDNFGNNIPSCTDTAAHIIQHTSNDWTSNCGSAVGGLLTGDENMRSSQTSTPTSTVPSYLSLEALMEVGE